MQTAQNVSAGERKKNKCYTENYGVFYVKKQLWPQLCFWTSMTLVYHEKELFLVVTECFLSSDISKFVWRLYYRKQLCGTSTDRSIDLGNWFVTLKHFPRDVPEDYEI